MLELSDLAPTKREIYTLCSVEGFEMPSEPDVRILLVLPASLYRQIVEHRHVGRLPSRMEAMRRLLRIGLASVSTVRAEKPNA